MYEVSSDIVTSGDCITIVAPNVVLGLHANITGDGSTGVGILISAGATGAVVTGAFNQVVTGFNIGVEDDEGGSIIGDFDVDGNATTGLLLKGPHPAMVNNMGADSNGHDGFHVQTSGHHLNSITPTSNGTYGLWIDGANQTAVGKLRSKLNGTTDLEISGSSNFIDGCKTVGGQFGAVIEKGASGNAIAGCGYGPGDTPPSVEGAVDKNKCGRNLWFANSFQKRTPRCIH